MFDVVMNVKYLCNTFMKYISYISIYDETVMLIYLLYKHLCYSYM